MLDSRLDLAPAAPAGMHVTVRIEAEIGAAAAPGNFVTDDPAFGIWRDRKDMADVQAYLAELRAPQYVRNEP